jgi:hypothetical protein
MIIFLDYPRWSRRLPQVLGGGDTAFLLPSLTRLTLELDTMDNHSTNPPEFGEYVNAYFDNRRLSGRIKSFRLFIICTGGWANNLTSYPGCGWREMNARLSDAMQFPSLQSVKLTFVHGYYNEGKRVALWEGGDSGSKLEGEQRMVSEMGNVFMDTRARGVQVAVEVLYPDLGDAVKYQLSDFSGSFTGD